MTIQRIFHGRVIPRDFARTLMGEFNRGNLRAQTFGNEKHMVVQITTNELLRSGGQTAVSVTLKQVEDGVAVQVGQQSWMGIAASLGQTFFSAWRNPWNIFNRLDDLAQDIQSLQLLDEIETVIEKTATAASASFELSERLRRMMCGYCGTANQVGASNCIACGGPLGKSQPATCPNCGFVLKQFESQCPNCKFALIPQLPVKK